MANKFSKEIINEISKKVLEIENETMRSWSNNYLFGHLDHYKSVFNALNPYLKDTNNFKILDIGGVPSHMDAVLKKSGYDVEVVDINPDRIAGFLNAFQIISYKVNIETEELPMNDNSYDIILFNEILEHLRVNPLNAMEEIKRVLKPNGILILSTPNITPFMRWQFFKGVDFIDDVIKEYSKLKTLGHMGHFRIYSEKELVSILDHFKFSILKKNYGGKIDYVKGSSVNKIYRTFYKNLMLKQIYLVCKNEK